MDFFLARVEQARAEGEAATLAHVRERCARSQAAWQSLADKAKRSERLREEEAKRKDEQSNKKAESTAETRDEDNL